MKRLNIKREKLIQSIFLPLVTLSILITFLSACNFDPQPVELPSERPEIETEQGQQEYVFINPLSEPDYKQNTPLLTAAVREKKKLNEDTVGWLQVPGTHIDGVVVCNDDPDDKNEFYLRRNFEKQYYEPGIFYADYRTKFGSGKPSELSKNIVIYGHTLNENFDGLMFAPLKYFTVEDFAKETPYIYFSTAARDMAFEVFAVFYPTEKLIYNIPNLSAEKRKMVLEECRSRSIYNYDVPVTEEDTLLTLSTCTYTVPGLGYVGYPSKYRYVIMAKLVKSSEATKTEAKFEVNPSPKAP